MGMFDSVYTNINCPCGKQHDVEIQFKVYLGYYEPCCFDYKLRQKIEKPFPQINFETTGTFECGGNYYDAIIEFRKGIIAGIVLSIPESYKWTELPKGRRTNKKQLAEQEEQKRRSEGKSFVELFSEWTKEIMKRPSFGRLLFTKEPYPNHMKTENGWIRIREL